jgi:hypothetical protein
MMAILIRDKVLSVLKYFMLCASLMLISNAQAADTAGTPRIDLDTSEIHRLGERMYRDGLLSDGTTLRGYVRGDVPVDSTMFSCSNCHTRSGIGSMEGQVFSPPVNGISLYNPRYLYKDYIKNVMSRKKGVTRTSAQPLRPAYTDETLAAALRGGISSNGKELLPVMPRYALDDREMQILISYLKTLSSKPSPGVTDKSIHFATIVTDDVSNEDREAMLDSLRTLVTINQQTVTQRKLPQFAKMFRMLGDVYFRNITIATWELKGPPGTWRAQLEEYNRTEPAFAILGGISWESWQPIHDFCEAQQIPCLFPITDLPVISSTSWYTFYASKGYYQEGDTAARYLIGKEAPASGKRVLQIVRSGKEGEALAAGFNDAWVEAGNGRLETVKLPPDQPLGGDEITALIKRHQPTSIVLWGGPETIAALETVAADTPLPDFFVSSRFLGKAMYAIPEALRERAYITYPYRLPEMEKNFEGYGGLLRLGTKQHKDEKRIASRTFSMVHIFLLGLEELKLDFYRDNLLDVISMKPDQILPDYERYSFGPGQRYASKGCYIVQLGTGPQPKLLKRTDWVVF